ncbi:hypothetical protein BO79DRAFT_221058 [Aspergillus costaricaensis CBS 115574]|uniref:Uncharacterized protein n=1 Tax=Aspergillus costaricaensis CBS 115574 TaxID=1448317 RepID=A0ACD1I3G4_9EURO|nr:hypothetical protein BO79DRAFT_221058 [Aspergillus costaricaensis CBS 115574]RAK85105.1 hypothetical protein BO79DRAFT_221058 [Aspergillus costaricaensis CBS 115574]
MVPAYITVGSLWDGGIDMDKPSTENLCFWGKHILTASSSNRGTPSTLLGFYIYHNRQENVEVIAEEHSNIVSPKPNLIIQTPKVVSTVRWRFSKPIYGFYAGIVQEGRRKQLRGSQASYSLSTVIRESRSSPFLWLILTATSGELDLTVLVKLAELL